MLSFLKYACDMKSNCHGYTFTNSLKCILHSTTNDSFFQKHHHIGNVINAYIKRIMRLIKKTLLNWLLHKELILLTTERH